MHSLSGRSCARSTPQQSRQKPWNPEALRVLALDGASCADSSGSGVSVKRSLRQQREGDWPADNPQPAAAQGSVPASPATTAPPSPQQSDSSSDDEDDDAAGGDAPASSGMPHSVRCSCRPRNYLEMAVAGP